MHRRIDGWYTKGRAVIRLGDFAAFVEVAIGTGVVGTGQLVTVGAGNQSRKPEFDTGPALALAHGTDAAFG
jgi:hypothetical protein